MRPWHNWFEECHCIIRSVAEDETGSLISLAGLPSFDEYRCIANEVRGKMRRAILAGTVVQRKRKVVGYFKNKNLVEFVKLSSVYPLDQTTNQLYIFIT